LEYGNPPPDRNGLGGPMGRYPGTRGETQVQFLVWPNFE
jgi:hypothetical protein